MQRGAAFERFTLVVVLVVKKFRQLKLLRGYLAALRRRGILACAESAPLTLTRLQPVFRDTGI